MKELDLHGLTHDEAVLKAEDFVLELSIDELFECRLITGNSMRMQSKLIEMLNEHDFKLCFSYWNICEIIVHYYFL